MLFAVEQFGKAIGLARGNRLADGDKRDFADGVLDAGFLERALGFSNRSDLRVAIGAAGEIGDFAHLVAGDVETFDALDGLLFIRGSNSFANLFLQ